MKDKLEELSAKFHDIYQLEAKRQSDLGLDEVRHPDKYEDLPERTKEYDRVLARYVLDLLTTQKESFIKIIDSKKPKCPEHRKHYEPLCGRCYNADLTIITLDDLKAELSKLAEVKEEK